MMSTQAGPVPITTVDAAGKKHTKIIPDVLYCKKVTVNLISAIRLCDAGFKMQADLSSMSFINNKGDQIHASRIPHTADLWATAVSISNHR